MRFYLLMINVILVFIILSACNTGTEHQAENSDLQKLNTVEQFELPENEDRSQPSEADENDSSQQTQPKNDDVEEEEKNLEPIDKNDEAPSTEGENQEEDSTAANELQLEVKSDTNVTTPLHLKEFKERWNAISYDFSGENFLSSLQLRHEGGEDFYVGKLNEHLELQVFANEDNSVRKIKIISTENETKKETFATLSSWWQLLLITNPTVDWYDIDIIFAEIGIGPNANINDITQTNFRYGGLYYEITPTQLGYTFEATYPTN